MITVVMAKVPSPGRVKTRLIPLIGPEGAAALARAMAEDVVATVTAVGPARLAVDGDLDDPWLRSLGLPVEAQAPGDLGARLRHALREGGVAVGTDSPTLPAALLTEARTRLEGSPPVVVPAFDGGYVAVGAWPDSLGIFSGVPWSASDTFAASVERARSLGILPTVLPFWYDVDTASDLTFLRAHLRALPPSTAPRTRAFLQDLPDAAALR